MHRETSSMTLRHVMPMGGPSLCRPSALPLFQDRISCSTESIPFVPSVCRHIYVLIKGCRQQYKAVKRYKSVIDPSWCKGAIGVEFHLFSGDSGRRKPAESGSRLIRLARMQRHQSQCSIRPLAGYNFFVFLCACFFRARTHRPPD